MERGFFYLRRDGGRGTGDGGRGTRDEGRGTGTEYLVLDTSKSIHTK